MALMMMMMMLLLLLLLTMDVLMEAGKGGMKVMQRAKLVGKLVRESERRGAGIVVITKYELIDALVFVASAAIDDQKSCRQAHQTAPVCHRARPVLCKSHKPLANTLATVLLAIFVTALAPALVVFAAHAKLFR